MHRVVSLGLIIFLLFFNSISCNTSQAAELPNLVTKIAKSYNHIFIGTAINKTILSDRTTYIFNVTEYLKHPINSTKVILTVDGGSEIAVSPSTSFSLGVEYIMFFDEIDDDYRIVDTDYYFTLLSSLDSTDIENIFKVSETYDAAVTAQEAAETDIENKSQTRARVNALLFIAGLFVIILLIKGKILHL